MPPITSTAVPEALRQLPQPVTQLYTIGNTTLLERALPQSVPYLAIVGSRKATPYGLSVTHLFASYAANHGVVIVSGLALGIDAAAHQAAVSIRAPTIAVLAGGLDVVYPARNLHLAKKIVDSGGLLLSEYPVGSPALAHQFIARNRIIAALADGVLLPEAAEKSGSLHTAEFALDMGKVVMAVPGSVLSESSRGANNLLQRGAAAAITPDDVFLHLGFEARSNEQPDQLPLASSNPEEQLILQLLKQGIANEASLSIQSGLAADRFAQAMTNLELFGQIRPYGAGQWVLRR